MKKRPSIEQAADHLSPRDVERLQRMIEVYATQTRIKWELPVDAESDLQSCGHEGLSQALKRFDGSRGAALPTYAEHRIRGAIKNGARAMYKAKRRAALTVTTSQSKSESGTGDRWDSYLDFFEEVAIGAIVSNAYESSAIVSLNESAEDRMIREEDSRWVHTALAALPDRSQHALRSLFFDELSGDALADQLKINKSNVTQLKKRALAELLMQWAERDGT